MTAEEIAEDILNECLAGRTLQIARIVSAQFERALRPAGITPHQLTLLSMICKRPKSAARDLLPYLEMDQSTLSRNLERMAEKGLLESSFDPEDRRMKLYEVSSAGKSAIKSAHSHWLCAQEWAREQFGDAGAQHVRGLAARLNPLLPSAEDARS